MRSRSLYLALPILVALSLSTLGGCNGANGNHEAARPRSSGGRVVTVAVGSPSDIWIDDLPLIKVSRGRSEGHPGYEVWVEVNGVHHVQFWRRNVIDFGDGAARQPDKWRRFSGQRVRYPGTLTAEAAPRIHESIMWVEQNYRGQAEGGISAMEMFGVVSVLGSLVPAGSSSAAAGGAGAAKALPSGRSVWSLGWAERGRRIEAALGGGGLPSNYPVIDKFSKGVATSIKSLDLSAKSYQSEARVFSRVKRYIDELAAFHGRNFGGFNLRASQIARRVLEVAIPHSGTAAQQKALHRLAAYAQGMGVELRVMVFP